MYMRLVIISMILVLLSCSDDNNSTNALPLPIAPPSIDYRLSAAVAFSYSNANVQAFLENPTRAYVSGYFYIPDDLANDVIFGLDLEFFEGVDNPLSFPGADWMAFVGITREGKVWVPIGQPENNSGTPTPNVWEVSDLNQTIASNTWYKMTITADFNTKQFINLELFDGSTTITFPLTNLPLQYPNYAAFNEACLTVYTHAARSRDLAANQTGSTTVYFDDIEVGLYNGISYTTVFTNGFETQTNIQNLPIDGTVITTQNIPEDTWFFENNNATVNITNSTSRTANYAIACDANLD